MYILNFSDKTGNLGCMGQTGTSNYDKTGDLRNESKFISSKKRHYNADINSKLK